MDLIWLELYEAFNIVGLLTEAIYCHYYSEEFDTEIPVPGIYGQIMVNAMIVFSFWFPPIL